jgi:hypothetical protein
MALTTKAFEHTKEHSLFINENYIYITSPHNSEIIQRVRIKHTLQTTDVAVLSLTGNGTTKKDTFSQCAVKAHNHKSWCLNVPPCF